MITPSNPPNSRPASILLPLSKDPFAKRPFSVFWKMTRACALACSHCRAEAQFRRDPNELSRREAEQVVDQLVELKPPMLVLTGGDPMERTDVLDIASRASAAGLRVPLSPSTTERLLESEIPPRPILANRQTRRRQGHPVVPNLAGKKSRLRRLARGNP